jgi:ankyrin repeat protein
VISSSGDVTVAMKRLVHRFRSRDGERSGSSDAALQNSSHSRMNPAAEESSNRLTRPDISIHDAAAKGLTEVVVRRLEEGVPIDANNSDGSTALHLAIKEGHVGTARLLLERKANIEAPNGALGAKPVHLVAMTMNADMTEMLLEYKPNLESRLSGLTALFFAISAGNETVVRLLLEAGADARARTLSEVGAGESVLHMAAGTFNNSMLPILIRHGADVNVAGTNPMGQTALHIAAQYGNTEAVEELIKAGTDINAKFPGGETALVIAARHGRVDAASALINHGMDPLACFDINRNAVIEAVAHGRTDMVRYFLDRYADRMDRAWQLKLVMCAAATDRIEILKMLDNRNFPMLDIDDAGAGALFLALLCKRKDAVVYMLRRGADPGPYITRDPSSLAAAEEITLEINKLLQEAESQRRLRSASELFPRWRYRDEYSSSSAQADLMATIISVNATRRIQANQEPAGVFSCRTCHDLAFRRGKPPDAEIVYFMAVGAMKSAAAAGCKGCRFLSDCLAQARKAYGAALWNDALENSLVLYSMSQGAPLLVHLKDSNTPTISIPSEQIEIFVKEGKI